MSTRSCCRPIVRRSRILERPIPRDPRFPPRGHPRRRSLALALPLRLQFLPLSFPKLILMSFLLLFISPNINHFNLLFLLRQHLSQQRTSRRPLLSSSSSTNNRTLQPFQSPPKPSRPSPRSLRLVRQHLDQSTSLIPHFNLLSFPSSTPRTLRSSTKVVG